MQKITVQFILILLFLSSYTHGYAAGCAAVSVSPPTFPAVTSGSGLQTPVTVPLTFTCTGSGTVTIGINAGLHYSGGRNLSLAGVNIPYIITDNANNLWGDGITSGLGGVLTTNESGSPQQTSFTVTVPGNIPSGDYTDQLTINLNDGTATYPTTLNLTFSVLNSCTISSNPTPINFGTVPAGATSVGAQTSTIGITCTNTAPYFWGADKGLHWSASRRMKAAGSADYIAYELKENSSPLGDLGMEAHGGVNTTGIPFRSAIGNASQQTYTINATVTTSPLPSVADAYSDTVSYTVAW